jgi:hypothetical protein
VSFISPKFEFYDSRTRDAILPEVSLGLDAVLTIDGVEITTVKNFLVL